MRVRCKTTTRKLVDLSVWWEGVYLDAHACVHPLATSNASLWTNSLHIIRMAVACLLALVGDPFDLHIVSGRGFCFVLIRVWALSLERKERMEVAFFPPPSRGSLRIALVHGIAMLGFAMVDQGNAFPSLFCPVVRTHMFVFRSHVGFLRPFSFAWDGCVLFPSGRILPSLVLLGPTPGPVDGIGALFSDGWSTGWGLKGGSFFPGCLGGIRPVRWVEHLRRWGKKG